MKFNTYNKFFLTAEYWKATVTVDAAGNSTTTLKFDRIVPCRIKPDSSGRTFLFTEETLAKGDHILSIKDSDGSLVDGKEYQITLIEPVLNVFGHREYLRYWCMTP